MVPTLLPSPSSGTAFVQTFKLTCAQLHHVLFCLFFIIVNILGVSQHFHTLQSRRHRKVSDHLSPTAVVLLVPLIHAPRSVPTACFIPASVRFSSPSPVPPNPTPSPPAPPRAAISVPIVCHRPASSCAVCLSHVTEHSAPHVPLVLLQIARFHPFHVSVRRCCVCTTTYGSKF